MKNLSRRQFNRTLATALGGLTLAGAACANTNDAKDKSLGIALVGLGRYSEYQLAPSLQETTNCHLAGIVTGTPDKAAAWKTKYDLKDENIYSYETFDQISSNKDIDIVYVVLPNALHADFCIRAARAGKHVICEKPMAVSVEECDAIIKACADNKVKLQVGYGPNDRPKILYPFQSITQSGRATLT